MHEEQITVAQTRTLIQTTMELGPCLTESELARIMSVYFSAIKRMEREDDHG